MSPAIQPNTEWQDGQLIDLETGEILDVKPPMDLTVDGPVISESLAEWILQRIQRHDARAASAGAHRERVKADMLAMEMQALQAMHAGEEWLVLCAQLEAAGKIEARATSAATFLRERFKLDLKVFAQAMLKDRKERTWSSVFGSLALRKSAAKIEIKDQDGAVAIAEALGCLEAIKKTVTLTGIKDRLIPLFEQPGDLSEEDALARTHDKAILAAHQDAIAFVPADESLTIGSGLLKVKDGAK